MIIRVDPALDRPLYLQIVDEVQRARVMGTLGADAPLPSVRELAGQLRVNPNTVQQAYRELEREGIVYVRRGQGTYLSDTGVNGAERGAIVRGVAERAVTEARRNGIGAEELIEAIRTLTAASEEDE